MLRVQITYKNSLNGDTTVVKEVADFRALQDWLEATPFYGQTWRERVTRVVWPPIVVD